MATNKDCLKKLELEMQELKEGMQKISAESQSNFRELRELFSKSLERGESSATKEKGPFQMARENSSGHSNRSKGSSGFAKLDFPRYSGDDPTVWLDRVVQYFDYKQTSEDQRVSLAAFHLESEANQWWQWMKKMYKEEWLPITWEVFERELLIRFGPTEVEDYDERIQQDGTLQEYQQEFERLANRVDGWPQKALVGTFHGGLKQEIVFALRIFKPKTLREAIELAWMRDDNPSKDQRTAQDEGTKQQQANTMQQLTSNTPAAWTYSYEDAKKLSWEEMQKRREKGLCFGCNERFMPGHRCQKPQVLFIEARTKNKMHDDFEESDVEMVGGKKRYKEEEPLISLN